MTFSLVARCAQTGAFGVVIASSSPAVAARCAYTRAGVGAVASQNVTDPRLGPLTLDLMEGGLSATEAVRQAMVQNAHPDFRQLLAVDANATAAIHSGPRALGQWSEAQGHGVAAGGNLLAHTGVPGAMVAAFLAAAGTLGDRLIAALRAGRDAGGEAGPVHSAGMQIATDVPWPAADLRCDWTEGDPIEEIARAWEIYRPQMQDYITRALNPEAAPSYGVPGDE